MTDSTLGVTFIDYDHDGDLDLYVTSDSHPVTRIRVKPQTADIVGAIDMWRNNGNGTFTDVTDATGLVAARVPVMGAVGTDYNNDRAVDIWS